MPPENKRLVIDIDGVLTIKNSDKDYENKTPNKEVIQRIREYDNKGYYIILQTARNMRTFDGRIGKINAETAPVLHDWLDEHDIPYDELHFGKPWCGHDGFYIDDKAIRPGEFVDLGHEDIEQLLNKEQERWCK